MQLKQLKLAGFKSFVEPTTVPFPGQLVAVVGPNGCGKSNIIDAVRWVMGESSAKTLRGESMTDVIFNGSNQRQPVGQCSVELLFDNQIGKVASEFAQYAEVSVRRKVTREGLSQYYLNGTKCRRKDITDLFLGTGLGPRSYAIIEQGMISRLIEAKPEELRVYVEEAAGISKYKERRKETESRMRRTHENLARLGDIRDELGRQLDRLQRQAAAAEKYKTYKQEERQHRAELQAIRWRVLEQEVVSREHAIATLNVELEKHHASQTAIDARIEAVREENHDAIDAFNQLQAQFYELGNDITRLEQKLQHQKEKAGQNQMELFESDRDLANAKKEQDSDYESLELLQESLEILAPELMMARESEAEARALVQDHESAYQNWQQQWDSFNQDAAGPRQTAEVSQSRIRHSEQVLERANRKLESLHREQQALESDPEAELISGLIMEAEAMEQQMDSCQTQCDTLTEQWEAAQGQLEQKRIYLNDLQQTLTQAEGRQATLEALQQAALGGSEGGVKRWLESHQLQHHDKLATQIRVADGWNQAVETVLGNYLQAVCVPNMSSLTNGLHRFEDGVLAVLEQQPTAKGNTDGLLSKVTSEYDLSSVLSGVHIADDLAAAMTVRQTLASHESVVTPDGIWMGKHWLRVTRDTQGSQGFLSRQEALEQLVEQIDEMEAGIEEAEVDHGVIALRVQSLHQERENAHRELTQVTRHYADFKARLSGKQVQVDQMQQRQKQLNAELEEQQGLVTEEKEQIATARLELQSALDAMEEGVDEREQLQEQRLSLQSDIDTARQAERVCKEQVHDWVVKEQSVKNKMEAVQSALARLKANIERIQDRRTSLLESQQELDDPDDSLVIELEERLESRLKLEEKLTAARQSREKMDKEIRELDGNRHDAVVAASRCSEQLQQAKIEAQAVMTRRDTLSEQLLSDHYDLTTLLDNLGPEADAAEWEIKIGLLTDRITRLGPINLAAIEEFKVQSERKAYLDAQNDDLEQAMATLEQAIARIDKETRNRFQETFERVNAGLQELFPKVFGGGHAYLELTGEDLLNTGVTIMARPPGKKNSTIHLLSGGEKALTAIALVFSIFKLNPAPFCLLDEVDAPLDDANVARYARLVDAMSEQVQFIFITHNKIAMEMAKDLMGVTMSEPGVSRLVSVNVEQAAELAGL